MSTAVADKAPLAGDNQQTSKSCANDAGASSNRGEDAQISLTPNKDDDDNERLTADTHLCSSSELNISPSTGLDKSAAPQVEIEKIATGTKDGTQNDSSSPQPSRRPSTTSRFKEKRPEPLRLNPNQEIPLDLSVKSAGNVPSGNIFNLPPINFMGALETPRIQWQDNDTLLASAKSRLFSSSTNNSQRARLSSLIGESPPITPSTPLMDLIFSPSGSAAMRMSNEMPHSASFALESPLHSFLISPLELSKLQFLDKLAQSNKPLINYQFTKSESRGTPRRSCSTDNLNGCRNHVDARNSNKLKVNQDDMSKNSPSASAKKNSISPLAIKSFSNRESAASSPTKFPYSNQQIATTKSDNQKSPSSSSNSSINGKSLTPTSVANATANLLNIHLNSPNGHSSRSPLNPSLDMNKMNHHNQFSSTNFSSFDGEPSPLDPLLSAVSYCQQQQQHQQQQRSSFASFPSPSNGLSHDQGESSLNSFQQPHPSTYSITSTATLNTPTLISPSQMKDGQLCFLPSPTLSPMSSVFELPSPLLMFSQPPNAQMHHHRQQQHQQANCKVQTGCASSPQKTGSTYDSRLEFEVKTSSKQPRIDNNQNNRVNSEQIQTNCSNATRSNSENNLPTSASLAHGPNDLRHLITTAAQKSSSNRTGSENDDIDMEVDGENSNPGKASSALIETSPRPATAIPQICVSNHQNSKLVDESALADNGLAGDSRSKIDTDSCSAQREQRDLMSKRSLSPKSYLARVTKYHDERQESSSAPPDVYQRRAKSKLKTITADSCFNLADKTDIASRSRKVTEDQTFQDKITSLSQSNIHYGITQRERLSSKPYPDLRNRIAASSQHIQHCGSDQCGSSSLTARSNSAEPAVYLRANSGCRDSILQGWHGVQGMNSYDCGEKLSSQIQVKPNISTSAQYLPHVAHSGAQGYSNGSYQQVSTKNHWQLQTSTNQQAQYLQQDQNYQRPNYQSHQTHHQHQQNSHSAGNLYRMQGGTQLHQGCPAHFSSNTVVSTGNEVIASQSDRQQQNIPFSSNRPDNLSTYNGYQHQFAQQQGRQNPAASTNMTASNSVSILKLAEQQTQNSRLLGYPYGAYESALRKGSTINPATGEQRFHHQPMPHIGNMSDPLGRPTTATNISHCAYPLGELESRSESRSSCSLDFVGSFGGSRSNSSASSNLVAKKYHCDHCSKSFTRSDMLTRHRRLHSGDRPFQCSECKQEFSRSDHLSTHMRTHTGEKPYKCKLCSYSACRKDMITRHLKVHTRNPHSSEPS